MSYQVLARKYRPKNFETLVGQEHVVRALTHALQSGRLHHAYLFTGTRGVGKTTLSRILAKSLNCIGPDGSGGITARPCGVCDVCSAIDAGRFVDYIEMDAASNRGVDEMAQLLEQAVYAPSNARFKVYMIDEVHMLTNHAFNAMLKTLEEPPDHVKFILATTDPQKIPVTVLSRCLQFNLKQMPPGHIIGHLDDILGQEGIAFEQPALRLLAQGAHGSMRDALSLTDQAIAYAAGEVTLEAVQGMLGALDQSYLIRLLDAIEQQNGIDLLVVADEMAARSLSYNGALQDLGTLLHRIALAQTVPAAVPADLPEHADIMRLASAFDAEDVQLYYQIAVHGRNELGLAPDEYAGFSMTLLRMLAFRPIHGAAESAPRVATPAPTRPAASIARVPAKTALHAPASPAAVPPATLAGASSATSPASATSGSSASGSAAPGSARAAALEAARGGISKNPTNGARTAGRPSAASAVMAPPAPTTALLIAKPPKAPAPWEDRAATVPESRAGAMRAPASRSEQQEAPPDEDIPSWVTEFSDDAACTALPAAATETVPAMPPVEPQLQVAVPIPGLEWDGDWPAIAAILPLRGVVQQLAMQTELIECRHDEHGTLFRLRVPIETWCTSNNIDKLAAVLTEHFQCKVDLDTELGPVWHTASARAQTRREASQRQAEQAIDNDPFVQSMVRDFDAIVVPGSVKPTLH